MQRWIKVDNEGRAAWKLYLFYHLWPPNVNYSLLKQIKHVFRKQSRILKSSFRCFLSWSCVQVLRNLRVHQIFYTEYGLRGQGIGPMRPTCFFTIYSACFKLDNTEVKKSFRRLSIKFFRLTEPVVNKTSSLNNQYMIQIWNQYPNLNASSVIRIRNRMTDSKTGYWSGCFIWKPVPDRRY